MHSIVKLAWLADVSEILLNRWLHRRVQHAKRLARERKLSQSYLQFFNNNSQLVRQQYEN